MKYDDLEKTKDLFEIDMEVPEVIESIEMEGASKDTITDEFSLDLTKENDIVKEEKKDKKPKKKLSKKQKIIIIASISLILIIAIVALILVFTNKKKDKDEVEEPSKPKEPVVIIEKDNYIYKDGVLSLLDEEDKEIGTYECKNKDEKLCFVAYYSNEDQFDVSKNVYENDSEIERRTPIIRNNYAFIYDNESKDNGSITLYNLQEQKEIGSYALVKGFKDSNYVILKNNEGKYGAMEFTNENATEKIKFNFDYLGQINKDSRIVAKTNNKYYIYGKDGSAISKALNYPIKNYNNGGIVVDNSGEYIYDYKGKLIDEGSYEYISLLDDYFVVVKDSKLYVRDYKNNKYNEEGIEVFNKNYNEKNVFDSDNKLISSKVSFKLNIVDDKLEVTYLNRNDKEKTTSLSLSDGKLSVNYPNLNYLDGKLYFYKEENKKTLLGSYTCTNKNNGNLDNCNVLKENDSLLPIINERFVFILDSNDKENKIVKIHDLKNDKTLRYNDIITGIDTKSDKITFETNNNLFIKAINKNNEYGVIKIEDEIKSVVPFNNKEISEFNGYNVTISNSSGYTLYDKSWNKLTEELSGKIVDYKNGYLTLEDNGKYKVVDAKNNELDKDCLHVILKDDFYVVIKEDNEAKKFIVKKYDDKDYELATTIDKDITDFSKIKVEAGKEKDNYIVNIDGKNITLKKPDLPSVVDPEPTPEEPGDNNEGTNSDNNNNEQSNENNENNNNE